MVTSDLEVNPPVQCYESLSVLDVDVASKQQQGERRDQSGVSQVDLGVPHLCMNCQQSDQNPSTFCTHVHFPPDFAPSPGTAASRASAGVG